MWGYSSVGRAPALQAGGQEFEPPYLHHPPSLNYGVIGNLDESPRSAAKADNSFTKNSSGN